MWPATFSRVVGKREMNPMKVLLMLFVGAILWVLCWPLVILAVLLWPLIWLLSIPFRVVGIVVGAALGLLKALLFLPVKLLS